MSITERQVPVPQYKEMEKTIEVPKHVYRDKPVEKIVERYT